MEKRICKKCLLRDTDEAQYFKNLYAYIESIDSDIKVDDIEYNRRLGICKNCELLQNGMCRICGCFVELRAVIIKNYCPSTKKKW